MKKKVLALLVSCLMMVTLLAACGGTDTASSAAPASSEAVASTSTAAPASEASEASADGDKMVIGMSAINLTDAGLVLIKNGSEYAAEDYNCELIWKACDGNLDTQIDVIRGFIQQGVDAIWIDSVDVDGIIPVVNEATEAGIIVLTAGSKVLGDSNYNLIYPDYDDAYFAATGVGEYYKDAEGTVGLIVGSAGNLVSEERQRGFTDGLAQYDNLTLVTEQGEWDATIAMQKAEDLIRANPDLLHIHVIADGMSFGAYQGVVNAGADITMSANDGESEALDHLEAGDYIFENLVGNERLGYWGVAVARRLFEGETMAIDQFLPTYKVMTDDIRTMMEDAGLTTVNGVDYEFITIDEAREKGSSEAYRVEFDRSFVPTQEGADDAAGESLAEDESETEAAASSAAASTADSAASSSAAA